MDVDEGDRLTLLLLEAKTYRYCNVERHVGRWCVITPDREDRYVATADEFGSHPTEQEAIDAFFERLKEGATQ